MCISLFCFNLTILCSYLKNKTTSWILFLSVKRRLLLHTILVAHKQSTAARYFDSPTPSHVSLSLSLSLLPTVFFSMRYRERGKRREEKREWKREPFSCTTCPSSIWKIVPFKNWKTSNYIIAGNVSNYIVIIILCFFMYCLIPKVVSGDIIFWVFLVLFFFFSLITQLRKQHVKNDKWKEVHYLVWYLNGIIFIQMQICL